MKPCKAFAPIRMTDGEEWIDYLELHCIREEAEKNARRTDKNMPLWAKDNPLQRITEVEIKEV